MAGMELKTELKQAQHLSPQMLQSTKILQMDVQELHDYVEQALENNPVLEKAAEEQIPAEAPLLRFQKDGVQREFADGVGGDAAAWNDSELSVQDFLNDQLARLTLDEPLRAICGYLVQLLDENGYLAEEDLRLLEKSGVPPELLARGISVLQGLEPAGIAARNLRECLLLQLERQPLVDDLSYRIIERHLDALSKHRWRVLANELRVTEDEIHRAAEQIRSLSPRPGYSDAKQCRPEYVIPDIIIKRDGAELELILNECYIPRICISDYYNNLYRTAQDEETKTFLRERMQQAKWIIDGLQRRYSTLLACGQLILETQRAFFMEETSYTVPMTQKQAAEKLGLHESTLGRCIRGKYLQCRLGTYPLQYFFSRPLPEGERSEQALRVAMQELICHEDSQKPYSDRKLAELLQSKGFSVARRTVTKYRLAMQILPAGGRKKYSK